MCYLFIAVHYIGDKIAQLIIAHGTYYASRLASEVRFPMQKSSKIYPKLSVTSRGPIKKN